MDNNYLWEIFTSQQIEDHNQLLQIPFQLNGYCQQEDHQIHQDLKGGPHNQEKITSSTNKRSNLDHNTKKIKKGLIRRRESTSDDSNKIKKVVHRNVERNRRQQMANLLASLRSLLPYEFIKGKRSTSDHMQVAVDYIRQLQKNIQDLDNRRKKLMENSLDENLHTNSVTVNQCQDGMEILINVKSSHKEEMLFPLSKVMGFLLKEGLDVVTCVNSKQDDWTFIRIQCQVSDISDVAAGLQKKLNDVIN